MTNIVGKVVELSGASGFDTNDGDFDLLREAVIAADLAGPLSDGSAEFTVFAPTDAAFIGLAQTLGYSGSDEGGSLNYILDALALLGGGDPIPTLGNILSYHVVEGEFFLADVAALGNGAEIPTLLGPNVTLNLDVPGLEDLDPGLPDPALIGFDVDVDNGVIHVLDGVLLPLPVSNILSQPGTDFEIGDSSDEFFFTGRGSDFVDGNGGRDKIFLGSGSDVALGGDGNDKIFGQRGNDTLLGEDGHDKIFGGRGRDEINGGAGNDLMIGGGGRDTFVFENGSDHDKILGFRDGRDKIDLSGYDGIESFADIEHNISGRWFGSKIHLDDGDSIYLAGVRAHRLDESDFIFADNVLV
ncbi:MULTISPECIES: fasciclin domain-containing protein [unclassified Roseovarius]|uniref:fasciclin domain-containing protein n=1 Tax=unclassified Roseovarius TaxID=2614913 RepID=UPI00273D4A85|nr:MULTISPECIES: fasciclin domain-containing protein [unclassified Roseovarius]